MPLYWFYGFDKSGIFLEIYYNGEYSERFIKVFLIYCQREVYDSTEPEIQGSGKEKTRHDCSGNIKFVQFDVHRLIALMRKGLELCTGWLSKLSIVGFSLSNFGCFGLFKSTSIDLD